MTDVIVSVDSVRKLSIVGLHRDARDGANRALRRRSNCPGGRWRGATVAPSPFPIALCPAPHHATPPRAHSHFPSAPSVLWRHLSRLAVRLTARALAHGIGRHVVSGMAFFRNISACAGELLVLRDPRPVGCARVPRFGDGC